MEKKKFKVGDRVRVIVKDITGKGLFGKTGTIKMIDYDGTIGVQFDENIGGHNLGHPNKCKEFHGWWCIPRDLELIKPETIVIYRKGNQVIAHNKATDKKGIAKCCPEDTFDFNVGAKLAFDRLMNVPKIVKQDKYEIGDKVKIIDEWVKGCNQSTNGLMDKYLGTIMTINSISSFGYYMEGSEGWIWNNKCIEGKVVEEPKLELEPEPEFKIGDLVEITENFFPKYLGNQIGMRGEIVEEHSLIKALYKVDFKVKYPFTVLGTTAWINKACFKKVD